MEMGKPTYLDAVYKLLDDRVQGGPIDGPIADIDILLQDGEEPPTESQIQTKLTEMIAEYDAKQYQRDRAYPEIGEQLDLLYHDMVAGKGDKTGEWFKAVKKVKDDTPKP